MAIDETLMEASRRIVSWRRDPCKFVREELGAEPDGWQAKALRGLVEGKGGLRRIALRACAGPGKTAVLAWTGWWFLSCWGDIGRHPVGAAVSITADNLSDNLWPELSRWQQRSAFLRAAFTWTKTRIFANDHPETWFLSARAIPRTANAEEQGRVLSGLHSDFIFYLMDETGDMPIPVLRTAEQGLTTAKVGLIMQAGNPTSTTGMLYHSVSNQAELWNVISITGDPDDPDRSSRIDINWAKEQIELYGRDNPWVMAYILGEFPPTALNALLSPDDVRAAMKRGEKVGEQNIAQRRIGVDVARFGDDMTVLFPRQGLIAGMPVEMRGARTNEIAARLMMMKKDFHSEIEMIDDTGGWGAGVIDSYLQAGHSALGVNFSSKATNPKYFNKRSEMWFEMAEWVKRGGCLPNVPALVREMSAPTYTFSNGKFRVEEKSQIKQRLGYSPDRADALALTFALPETHTSKATMLGLTGNSAWLTEEKMITDWDPFDESRP